MTPVKGFDQTCPASMLIRIDGGKMNQKTWYMTSRTLDSEGRRKTEGRFNKNGDFLNPKCYGRPSKL